MQALGQDLAWHLRDLLSLELSLLPQKNGALSTKLHQLQVSLVQTSASELLSYPFFMAKGKEEQVPLIPSY